MQDWIKKYFNQLCDLQSNARVTNQISKNISLADGFMEYIRHIQKMLYVNGKLIFIGNGGSAGISSHLAIDYSKNGHIPALAFNDPSALTCLGNDFGYEHIFAKQVEFHARTGDILVAISSSGISPNIIKAVTAARAIGCAIITLSGFDSNNPLSQLGDLNFYINAKEYGLVEVAHLALGHAMLDYIIQEKCIAGMQQETAFATA